MSWYNGGLHYEKEIHSLTVSLSTMKLLSVLALASVLAGLEAATFPNCPYGCDKIFNAVCGKNSRGDAKTFYNFCSLELHNCYNQEDYMRIHDGKCRVSPVYE